MEMRCFSCSGRAGAPWQGRGVGGAPRDAPLPAWGWSWHPQSLYGAFLVLPPTGSLRAALCQQEMGAKSTAPSQELLIPSPRLGVPVCFRDPWSQEGQDPTLRVRSTAAAKHAQKGLHGGYVWLLLNTSGHHQERTTPWFASGYRVGFRSCRSVWGVHGGGHGPFPWLGGRQSSLLRAKVPGASFIPGTEPAARAEPRGLCMEGVNPAAPSRRGPPATLRQAITPTVLNTTSNPVCQPPPIIPRGQKTPRAAPAPASNSSPAP